MSRSMSRLSSLALVASMAAMVSAQAAESVTVEPDGGVLVGNAGGSPGAGSLKVEQAVVVKGATPADDARISNTGGGQVQVTTAAGAKLVVATPVPGSDGQVLVWSSGSWQAVAPPPALPATAGSGQILAWNGSAWVAQNAPSPLPATAATGQILTWNGSAWVAAVPPTPLPASAATNQVLTWNGSAWVAQNLPVELPAGASGGQALVWNGSAWVASALTTASVSGLNAALDAKSPVGHGHGVAEVAGLQAALDGKLAAAGGTVSGDLTVNGGIADGGGQVLRLVSPAGASFSLNAPSVSGVLKVTLPQSWSNTMMRFTVKIYDFAEGESFDVLCSGYAYAPTTSWMCCTAVTIGHRGTNREIPVRFGHDGSKCCVWIGDVSSTWDYPQVAVTDFQAGYSNFTASQWSSGWAISLVNALNVVNVTVSATQIGRDAVQLQGAVPSAAATGDTIARRDANGDLFGRYLNQSSPNDENPGISQVVVTNGGDNFLRKASIAHLKSSLALTAGDVGAAAASHTQDASSITGVGLSGDGRQMSHSAWPTDFNEVPTRWGWGYVHTATNAPTGSTQHYRCLVGLGSEYATNHGLDIAVPRAATNGADGSYFYTRQKEGGTWGAWSKLKAGYADSAGSVAWNGITGLPTGTVAWSGWWGSDAYGFGIFPARPNDTRTNGQVPLVINQHTGLSLSAHDYYGGVRIFSQQGGSPYAHDGALRAQFSGGCQFYGPTTVDGNTVFHGGNITPLARTGVGSGYYSASTWIDFGASHAGLFDSGYGHHFWPETSSLWGMKSVNGMAVSDTSGNRRGYLYHDGAEGNFGLLSGNGQWRVKVSDSAITLNAPTYLNGPMNNSYGYYFQDGNHFITGEPTGSYGAVRIGGNKNGWSGIDFSDVSQVFMVHQNYQGFLSNQTGNWQWYFQDGVLSVGTVPWGRLSGQPTTLLGYGITDAASLSHGHASATTSVPGFMSAADKAKIDTLPADGSALYHAGNITPLARTGVDSGFYSATTWIDFGASHAGLYDSGYGHHFWPETSNAWSMLSVNGMTVRGLDGVRRGMLFHDGAAGNFGLLSGDGNWKVMVSNSAVTLNAPTYLGGPMNNPYGYYFQDGSHFITGDPNSGYGSVRIGGNKNGWSGIDFSDAQQTFMVQPNYQGFYSHSGAWHWQFQNGVLAVGTVPWGRLSGQPTTLLGYGITDAASSSHGHASATTAAPGFMSAADKAKVDTLPVSGSSNQVLTWNGSAWVSAPAVNALPAGTVAGQTLRWNGSAWEISMPNPAGQVSYYATATAPAGWLIANGDYVRRDLYPRLYDAINGLYGAAQVINGLEHFKLPDLRGEFIRGADFGRGVDPQANRNLGSVQADEMRSHTHTGAPRYTGPILQGGPYSIVSGYSYDGGNPTGAAGGAETRPRNVVLLPCISY